MQICADQQHRAEIEALLDRNLGPERAEKTAYRLRIGAEPIFGLSLITQTASRIVASVQYWPVQLIENDGRSTGLTLLGPIIVDTDYREMGFGSQLMRASLLAADQAGHRAIVLVGDPEYYGRFGFSADNTAGWVLPGPFEPHRLLLRASADVRLPVAARLAAMRKSAQ